MAVEDRIEKMALLTSSDLEEKYARDFYCQKVGDVKKCCSDISKMFLRLLDKVISSSDKTKLKDAIDSFKESLMSIATDATMKNSTLVEDCFSICRAFYAEKLNVTYSVQEIEEMFFPPLSCTTTQGNKDLTTSTAGFGKATVKTSSFSLLSYLTSGIQGQSKDRGLRESLLDQNEAENIKSDSSAVTRSPNTPSRR